MLGFARTGDVLHFKTCVNHMDVCTERIIFSYPKCSPAFLMKQSIFSNISVLCSLDALWVI